MFEFIQRLNTYQNILNWVATVEERVTTKHRVGEPSRARPLTPPSVRVRTWRFQ